MSKDRLWARLMELGSIGAQDSGGVTRLAFTDEERRAKELVKTYMKEAGLHVREDTVGNLIGRMEGKDPLLPVVMAGSHIDTVPHGGKFDGALGVLAAIEAVQRMHDEGIEPDHPIEVIAFTDEEGARFGFGMLGSRAVAGTLTQDDLKHRDEQQITIAQAMDSAGLDPQHISAAAKAADGVKAYLELHIEQSTVLEQHDLPIGVVSGIAGPLWLQFSLTGEAGHAGATPMHVRKDPMVAAAKIMTYIQEETKKYPNAVATVGRIEAKPGGINVIPGEVHFSLDLRDIDETSRDALEHDILAYAEQICKECQIHLQIQVYQRVAPTPCSPELIEVIHRASRQVGIEALTLPSGAGHDGMQFSKLWPVGMIFVRSKHGISHSPQEWSSPEDCYTGAEVLYHALLALAQR